MTGNPVAFMTAFVPAMLIGITAALAHPKLLTAVPAVGSSVKAAPSEVTLRFNERLEPRFTGIVVRDSDGKQVDKGDTKVDTSDRRIVRVSLPSLSAGSYKVEWHAMSADTHQVEGDFSFRVSP